MTHRSEVFLPWGVGDMGGRKIFDLFGGVAKKNFGNF